MRFHVGITGHRRFAEINSEKFYDQVEKILRELELKCGISKPILLSGLAAGADIIVAQIAVSRGWALHAVLAAPIDEFLTDFDELHEANAFNALINSSNQISFVAKSQTPSPERYCLVGEFIVKNSDWLIAIWDGDLSNIKIGGAAWVIQKFESYKEDNSLRISSIHVHR